MSHLRTTLVIAGLACAVFPAMTLAESPVAAILEPNVGRASPDHPAPLSPRIFTRADVEVLLADPAVRGDVGAAENSYDFNDPNGVPGFGPIGARDGGR